VLHIASVAGLDLVLLEMSTAKMGYWHPTRKHCSPWKHQQYDLLGDEAFAAIDAATSSLALL
jgi:hypothetical protein